jgi:hypothetical protein
MKTCVFITGTHAVGKSSLAWAIINRYGGVDRITNDVTYCKTGSVSLAGKYGVTRYGGVDRITNDKGSSCTSRLAEVVEEALRNADTVICEGSFMNTFGMNLTNAMFKAQRYLIVSLFCPPPTPTRASCRQERREERKARPLIDIQETASGHDCSPQVAGDWRARPAVQYG